MLFDASTVYAPGEPRGDVGYSEQYNMANYGRYNFAQQVNPPNVWIGLAVIAVVLFLTHKGLSR